MNMARASLNDLPVLARRDVRREPDGHGPCTTPAITVQWRGGDRWAILLGPNWSSAQVWCDRRVSGSTSLPSSPHPKFLARRLWGRDEALKIRRPTGGGRFVTAGTASAWRCARSSDTLAHHGHEGDELLEAPATPPPLPWEDR